MKTIKSKFYKLVLVIATTLLIALILTDRIIVQSHIATAHDNVKDQLQDIGNKITFNLYNNIQVVKSLPAFIAVKPSFNQAEFALAADEILDGHNQLRNIAAARDLVITHMYPIEGNEKAIGIDYRTLPNQINSVLRAKETKNIVVAGPVNLVQGGQGIISRAPVFIKDHEGNEHFWGIVSSVIDSHRLYEASGLFDANLPLQIAIRGKDGLGLSGEVFFGNPILFDQDNVTTTITLPNGSWQISAKPIDGWDAIMDDVIPKRLLAAAVALSLFLILFFSTRVSLNAATANLKFKNLLEGSPIPYALYNDKGEVTYLNHAFIQTFGYTLTDIPTLDDWWPKAYPDQAYREYVIHSWASYTAALLSSDNSVPAIEVNIRCKDGTTRTVLASLAETQSNTTQYPVSLYDITDRKQAEERLQLSQSAGGIGTWEANLVTNKMVWSDTFSKQLGFPEIPNPTWKDFFNTIYPVDRRRVLRQTIKHLENHLPLDIEYRITDQSGKLRWIRSIGKAEIGQQSQPTIIRGTIQEITTQKASAEKLSQMAHYDDLTQLPNRTLLADRFQQVLAHAKRTGQLLAICFLDLDGFKKINDRHGHNVGDQLLQAVAKRIKDTIRQEDTVSRQGGDEFALLLGDLESYSACEQFMARLLKILSEPYHIEGHTHDISASCGITIYPNDDADLDTLLRHADHAMYQAKQSGRNRYHLFNVEQDEQVSQRNHRLTEIEQALVQQEFQLYYQPKVNMLSGDVFGFEALIRWVHPEKGIIPPMAFLPVLADTELELKVGDWVINRALEQLDEWHTMGLDFEVSINISSHHLQSPLFFQQLDEALARHPDVDSKFLELEILESSALGDVESISQIIHQCQSLLGLKVALDDFGTGYSSLTHLRNLSANTIKIDQSFVRDILDDTSDYAIIEGVIGLANAFNRKILAEGVETTEHGLMLLIMGCHQAQGYGIAKPMPAKNVPSWLDNYVPNTTWLGFKDEPDNTMANRLLLFKLVSQRWIHYFNPQFLASANHTTLWSHIDRKSNHLSLWIKKEKQDALFDRQTLTQLDKAHKHCLALAHSIQLNSQDGRPILIQESLDELRTAFDDMVHILFPDDDTFKQPVKKISYASAPRQSQV